MKTNTAGKNDMAMVQEKRPELENGVIIELPNQIDVNEELAAHDLQAQGLIDQLFNMFEDG